MAVKELVNGRRGSLWTFAPVVLWIAVIFLLSSPIGAAEETSRIIGPLLNFFFPNMAESTKTVVHFYVRKTAHFSEYAALAFFALRALTFSRSGKLQKLLYLLPILLVAMVAMLDEFNQSFEASRTSSIWDVMLDISGGVAMTGFLWLIGRPKVTEPTA